MEYQVPGRVIVASSLRQAESIELIISSMRKHGVDLYSMQETWLGGPSVPSNKGHTIILLNNYDITCVRRGVGFVLAPRASAAWDGAGRGM